MRAPDENQRLQATRKYWDQAAAHFDDEPDHGLRNPLALQAWTKLLRAALPLHHGAVLDIGCGTGSLSLVLASFGLTVTGIDVSPEMLALAEVKAARLGYPIRFAAMDAAFPSFPAHHFDAIVCRHLLWALPQPKDVLHRWAALLKPPAGWLVLIEGFWHTGSGLHADEVAAALPRSMENVAIQNLSSQPDLWGGPVHDERYVLTARLRPDDSDRPNGLNVDEIYR